MDDRTSLDTATAQWSQPADGVTPRCPNKGARYVNLSTGETVLGTCRRPRCIYCGPRLLIAKAHVLASSGATHLMTLTRAPGAFEKVKTKIKQVFRRLRRRGHDVEAAWAVEQNPDGDGHHVHLLTKGTDDLELPTLSVTATLNGFGPVTDLRALPRGPRALNESAARQHRVASRYLVKAVLDFDLDTPESAHALDEHLSRNGGRALHVTRNFISTPEKEAQTLTEALRARVTDGEWVLLTDEAA